MDESKLLEFIKNDFRNNIRNISQEFSTEQKTALLNEFIEKTNVNTIDSKLYYKGCNIGSCKTELKRKRMSKEVRELLEYNNAIIKNIKKLKLYDIKTVAAYISILEIYHNNLRHVIDFSNQDLHFWLNVMNLNLITKYGSSSLISEISGNYENDENNNFIINICPKSFHCDDEYIEELIIYLKVCFSSYEFWVLYEYYKKLILQNIK